MECFIWSLIGIVILFFAAIIIAGLIAIKSLMHNKTFGLIEKEVKLNINKKEETKKPATTKKKKDNNNKNGCNGVLMFGFFLLLSLTVGLMFLIMYNLGYTSLS